MDKSIIENDTSTTTNLNHKRNNTFSYSIKEHLKQSNLEISNIKQNILTKEFSRPKILIKSKSIDKISNPMEYIKKIRQNFLIKNKSIIENPQRQLVKWAPHKQKKIHLSSMNKKSNSLYIYKQPKIPIENEVEVIPNWLMERADFQVIAKKFIDYSAVIPKICQEHPLARSIDSKNILFTWISSLKFFEKISSKVLREVCDKLVRQDFAQNETIIQKNEIGDCIYIIYSGVADIYLETDVLHCKIYPKSVIGEQALDNVKPRNATVIAAEPIISLKLSKYDYDTILLNIKKLEKSENSIFLSGIDCFKSWNFNRIQNLSYFLLQKNYKPGDAIYEKGKPSDTFYIIKSGSVEIQAFANSLQNNCWPIGGKEWKIQEIKRKYVVTVIKLGVGDFFGEPSELEKTQRCTKAISLTKTVLLSINHDEYFEFFSQRDISDLKIYARVIIPSEQQLEKKLKDELRLKSITVFFI